MKIKIPIALKTIGFITIAISFAKILGFVREIVFANFYGAGIVADAFVVSSRLPLIFFDFALGTAVLSSFIPVFSDILHKENKKKAFEFANNFFNIILVLSVVITAIVLIFAKQFILLMAPQLADVPLAVSLLYILFPTFIFTALAYVCVGILQTLDEFNIPAIISVVSNIIVIAYLLLFNQYFGIYGIAWAISIGWFMQIIIQIPSLIKKGFKWQPVFNLKDKNLITVAKMALPILISSWVQPLCIVINTRYASYLAGGTIASLGYANRLYILLTGVFSFAITNYIFPKMSKASSEENWNEYNKILNKSLISIIAIMLPITVFTMVLAEPLIKILFFRGEFDMASVHSTATALFYYSFGMIALGVNEILNKALFAKKQTKLAMWGAIVGIAANITMLIICHSLGTLDIARLALSVAVGSNANMLFLLSTQIRFANTD